MKNIMWMILTLFFTMPSNISFNNYQVTNQTSISKIPSITDAVTCTLVDNQGTIWVGTTKRLNSTSYITGGLYKSTDGINFQAINWIDSSGNNKGAVLSLALDKQGTLWVGTMTQNQRNIFQGALYKSIDKNSFTPVTWITRSVNNGAVYCLTIGQDGTIWAGTINNTNSSKIEGALYSSIDKNNFTASNWITSGTNNGGVLSLLTENDGTIWAGTVETIDSIGMRGGLYKSVGPDFNVIIWNTGHNYSNGPVTSLIADNDNNILAGTMTDLFMSGSMYKSVNKTDFNTLNWKTGVYNNGTPTALTMDSTGTIWAGSTINDSSNLVPDGILYKYNKNQGGFTSINNIYGGIKSLSFDKSDNLWIGTISVFVGNNLTGGLYKLNFITGNSNVVTIFASIFASIIIISSIILVFIYIIKSKNSYYKTK